MSFFTVPADRRKFRLAKHNTIKYVRQPMSKFTIQPFTPPEGVRPFILSKTKLQESRGLGELNAWIDKKNHHIVGGNEAWKLSYCWGWPDNPKFRAETKIKGKKVILHRLIASKGNLDSIKGLFVVPIDGDPLHCWEENLQILTKEERDAKRKIVASKRSGLNASQQALLEAECKRTKLSRWQVIGTLIDRCLPFEPDFE